MPVLSVFPFRPRCICTSGTEGLDSTGQQGCSHYIDRWNSDNCPSYRKKIRKVGKEFNAVDTTYISPNLYNLAFMLESSSWYEYYRLGSKGNNGEQSLGFSPNASFKLGVYFGWRWIFLGYSFDVKDIFGGHKNKAKKTEMALNLYSSKFGVDLYYRKTGSDFKIRSSSGFDLKTPIKNLNFNGLQSKIKGLNAYWIFNYKNSLIRQPIASPPTSVKARVP